MAKLAQKENKPLITRVGNIELNELVEVFDAMGRGEILGKTVMKSQSSRCCRPAYPRFRERNYGLTVSKKC